MNASPRRPFVFLSYVDDSGRFDKKKNTFQVLAAVMVHDKLHWHVEVNAAFAIPEDKSEAFEEFHAWELYGGYGVFDGMPRERRYEVIEDLLSLIAALEIPVVYGAVDVRKLQQKSYGSAMPIDVAFRICLTAINNYIRESKGGLGQEPALLILDNSKEKDRNNRLRQSFRELRRPMRPPDFDPGLEHIHDDMYFGDSKDSVGIQLADLSSYFIGKHLEGGDADAERFYEIIEPRIVYSKVAPE
jgi:hypothetical protein